MKDTKQLKRLLVVAFAILGLQSQAEAQLSPTQLEAARSTASTYMNSLIILSREPSNEAVGKLYTSLFSGDAEVYNDLLPENNSCGFASYLHQLKSRLGYVPMEFPVKAEDAKAWEAGGFIVLGIQKKISGTHLLERTVDNYLLISPATSKIQRIAAELPKGATVHGVAEETPSSAASSIAGNPPSASDRDQDGVPDEYDACPDHAGEKGNGGCPKQEEAEAGSGAQTFTIVEEQATPQGGMQGFYKYIKANRTYPRQAQRMQVEGKVYLEFIVDLDGSLTNIKVIRGIGGGCDEEAVRLMEEAPKWQPATQRGKAVRQKMTFPINFKLN